jgi:hypothetical protein
MASLNEFKAILLPPGEAVVETLCSQGTPKDPVTKARTVQLFGVFKLQNGKYLAAWENEIQKADTLEELSVFLNVHEKEMLRYGKKE